MNDNSRQWGHWGQHGPHGHSHQRPPFFQRPEFGGHGGHGPFGPHGPWGDGGGPGGRRGPWGQGGPGGGGKARRGEVRFVLLDALKDGPKHGYEIIKALEERSGGQYAPSPGTVYPTLQMLQDLGLVRADQDGDRRVFALTETGQAELAAHAEELSAFWLRFTAPTLSVASQAEIGFLRDELQDLTKTIWGGLRARGDQDDTESIRAFRRALERCKNEIRDIIAGNNSSDTV